MRIFIAAVLLMAAAGSHGATYYLDNSAAGPVFDGSAGTPWQTVAQAQTFLNGLADHGSGDTLMVAPGDSSYGDYVDGAWYTYNYTDLQKEEHERADWLVVTALDRDNPPEFRHLQVFGARNAYMEFSYLHVNSTTPHDSRFPYVINIEKALSHVRLLHLEVEAQDDSLDLPRGIGMSGSAGPPTDVLVEGCDVHHVDAGIAGSGYSIVVRNNHVHHTASSAIKTAGSTDMDMLVEGNLVHTQMPRIIRIKLFGTITGSFSKYETITQAVTGAKASVYYIRADHLEVTPINKMAIEFQSGYGVSSDTGAGTITSVDTITIADKTHGSGLSIRNRDKYTARNNVIYDFGGTAPITLYPDANNPFNNVLMENNLVYRSQSVAGLAMSLNGMKDNIIVRNNTLLGTIQLDFHAQSDGGSGLHMYNNIARDLTFYQDSCRALINEGNNIFNTVTVRYGGDRARSNVTETSTSTVLKYAESDTYYVNELFEDYAGEDFRIKSTSVAVDFGDPANAPAFDLNWYDRGASPDAGCYELGTVSGVSDGPLPQVNAVTAVFPNPVHGAAVMAVNGPIEIYNTAGKLILSSFAHGQFRWNGTDMAGRQVTEGTYFIKAGGSVTGVVYRR